MKIVKVNGCGKFNKAVEDELNELFNQALCGGAAPKYNPKYPPEYKAHFNNNPDELAFAE